MLQWCTVIPEMAYFCWAEHSNKMFLHHFLANRKQTDRSIPSVFTALSHVLIYTLEHCGSSAQQCSAPALLESVGQSPACLRWKSYRKATLSWVPRRSSRYCRIPHTSVLGNGMMLYFFISIVFKRYFLIRILMCFFIQRTS